MSVVDHASGTLTTDGTEQSVTTGAVAGRFAFYVDLNALVDGDVVRLRIKRKVLAGGTARVLYEQSYYGAQAIAPVKVSEPLLNDLVEAGALDFTVTHQFGTTGESIPWKVVREDTASQASITTLQADTDDIQTRIPAALVSGRIDASVGAMAANVMTAAAAAADLTTELQTGLATAAALATVDGIVDDILVDTAVIGALGAGLTAIPWNAAWDAEVQSEATDALNAYDPPTHAEVTTATANLDAAVSTRATPAQVNAEVLDVLTVDTFAEPAAVPAATASLKDKLGFLMALARNKITQTSTTSTLRNDGDAGTVGTSTVSDSAGTTTKGKWS